MTRNTNPVLDYAELQATSNFSFLRGASHPQEIVASALQHGLAAIAITDRNTLAGVVRGHMAAKALGIPYIVGCRLDLADGNSLLCYPTDRTAYGRLSRCLTEGKRKADKGDCKLTLDDVATYSNGQTFVLCSPQEFDHDALVSDLRELKNCLEAPLYLSASHRYRGDDRRRIAELATIASQSNVPLVATGDALYHCSSRRPIQDIVTCIRTHKTLNTAGYLLNANAERYLRTPQHMARVFAGNEHAVTRTMEVAERCMFNLDELRYNYPQEPVPSGKSAQDHLADLVWNGAAQRYPDGVSEHVRDTLIKELRIIEKLDYALYFLTVHDIVQWARDRDILCQGRGSAANSAVCFCLHITSVDPTEIDLLFERFVSEERKEPPDIDVDFEHERREEVIQYIYERYGRERAGIAATVISYRARSAVREVGKVMGLSDNATSALAGTIWGWSDTGVPEEHVRQAGLDPQDPLLRRTLSLAAELVGFPRHLSQHVGGFVLTEDPLCEVVPIGNAAMANRTFVEWDKDDLNDLGILKIDVLALGMLTCIRKCLDLLRDHYEEPRDLASFFPADDPETFAMLQRADTVGTFQVESRAQMSMLPRLKPKEFYDLVIQIAIVRPGPIQGNMVHPYLRRRNGQEPVMFPSPSPDHGPKDELERILRKTLGVPLFQEQAMKVAIDAAKFSPDEANQLRHAMATFRKRGTIATLEDLMVTRMVARGYDEIFARSCFDQIKGFGEYGFPESHSASFALLAYVSCWLKCHRPEVFACGLLNAQPMGFYAPAQIVRDARDHGVEVRPPDVNHSDWDSTLEPVSEKGSPVETPAMALRLGLRQINGLNAAAAQALVAARYARPERRFADVAAVHRHAEVSVSVLERLADGDAFRSMGLDRRQALWNIRGLSRNKALPLFAQANEREYGEEIKTTLPVMPQGEQVIADYQTLRLSLKDHPMALLRKTFAASDHVPTSTIATLGNEAWTKTAGVVLVRQRPGTAKGVMFMTIEDESGVANIVVWPKTFAGYRAVVMRARLISIRGRIQSHDGVIHLVAHNLEDHTDKLQLLSEAHAGLPLSHADEVVRPVTEPNPRRHPRDVQIMPKSRDFH